MDRDILTDLATGKEFSLKPLGEVWPHCPQHACGGDMPPPSTVKGPAKLQTSRFWPGPGRQMLP